MTAINLARPKTGAPIPMLTAAIIAALSLLSLISALILIIWKDRDP